jgi:pimeloyl-ACP methyl ester carboxylesterase
MSPAGHAFVDVDGQSLEVRRWPGTEPPILLLHEALGAITIWRDLPERMQRATGHALVAWAREGHGRSSRPDAPRQIGYLEREAERLPALMDALGVPQAHLLGHSDGASIAIAAAAMHPERVLSVVAIAPHVDVEAQSVEGIVAAQRLYAEGGLRTRLARHHDDVDHVFHAWHDVWTSEAFRSWSIEHLLPRVKAPVLAIQGHDDVYFSMRQVDVIDDAVPTARSLKLAACGHSPHLEQPEAVVAAIADFLRGLNAG